MRFTLPSTDVIAEDRRGYIAQSDGIYLVSALNRVDLVSLILEKFEWNVFECKALQSSACGWPRHA